jgi:hypothetical protein
MLSSYIRVLRPQWVRLMTGGASLVVGTVGFWNNRWAALVFVAVGFWCLAWAGYVAWRGEYVRRATRERVNAAYAALQAHWADGLALLRRDLASETREQNERNVSAWKSQYIDWESRTATTLGRFCERAIATEFLSRPRAIEDGQFDPGHVNYKHLELMELLLARLRFLDALKDRLLDGTEPPAWLRGADAQ